MEEKSEEAKDSISASSSSGKFELPEYILKNLTPAKQNSSKDNSHRIRKNELIRLKTLRLKKRSNLVKKRIRNLRMQQDMFSKRLADDLSNNIRLARERKGLLLEKRKQRARQIQISAFKLPTSVPSITGSSSAERCLVYDDMDVHHVVKIQKRIKNYLLLRNIEFLKKSDFAVKIRSLSYNETLKLLSERSNFTKTIVSLLHCMNLPDILPQDTYKSFLYSLLIIADYKDSLNRHTHSGVNTNIADKNVNNLTNSISLLLFKSAHELLNKFIDLVYCDSPDLLSPWSLQKLKFSKCWKIYHFVFQIFRNLHFKNCLIILKDALKIVQLQLKSVNDFEIVKQEENYVRNYKFLQKLSTTFKFVGDQWIYFGIEPDKFIQSIKDQLLDIIIPERPRIKISQNAIDELNVPVKNPLDHSITFDDLAYHIPPYISIINWRFYWFKKFRKEYNKYRIPIHLKSGFFDLNSRNCSSKLYIEDVLDDMGIESIHCKYERLFYEHNTDEFITQFDYVIANSFKILYEYCVKFEDSTYSEEFEIIRSQFRNLKDAYCISDCNSDIEVLHYFKLQFYCLSHLATIGPYNLDFVPNSFNTFIHTLQNSKTVKRDSFEVFIDFFKELEIMIMNLWLDKCKIESKSDFKRFENVCQLVSKNNFKIETGTNSPHMRFPLFYKFLSDNDTNFENQLYQYNTIINASFEFPNVKDSTTINSSFQYFEQVFSEYLLNDRSRILNISSHFITPNELNILFIDDIRRIKINCNKLLLSNCVLHLILNFYSNVKIKLGDKEIILLNYISVPKLAKRIIEYCHTNEKLTEIYSIIPGLVRQHLTLDDNLLELRSFMIYFNIEYSKLLKGKDSSIIKSTLVNKLTKLLKLDSSSMEYKNMLGGNFKYYIPEATNVITEINELIIQLYELYSPMLNWIYKDIGEPRI